MILSEKNGYDPKFKSSTSTRRTRCSFCYGMLLMVLMMCCWIGISINSSKTSDLLGSSNIGGAVGFQSFDVSSIEARQQAEGLGLADEEEMNQHSWQEVDSLASQLNSLKDQLALLRAERIQTERAFEEELRHLRKVEKKLGMDQEELGDLSTSKTDDAAKKYSGGFDQEKVRGLSLSSLSLKSK